MIKADKSFQSADTCTYIEPPEMDELTDEDSGDMRGYVLIFNLNG
jgi:hypothetical protein